MRHAFAMAHSGRGPRGFGGHGPWGWGGGFGGHGPRRGRSRRGDVRAAILLLLEEEPRNGYGLMQEIEERSSGAWRPSPGSTYPALAQLEDEGLIAPAPGDQGKAFALTDAGRAYVDEHRDHLGSPWEAAAQGMPAGAHDVRKSIGQLAMASMQAVQAGDADVTAKVREILDDARRRIYRLLAGEDER